MALFHAKRELRLRHDSFVVTASHSVILQTTLSAHGVSACGACEMMSDTEEKDWYRPATRPTQRRWADSGIATLALDVKPCKSDASRRAEEWKY